MRVRTLAHTEAVIFAAVYIGWVAMILVLAAALIMIGFGVI
jgi:hypothetical protein